LKLATADEDSEEVTPDKVYNKGELKKLIEATELGGRDRLFVMVPGVLGLRIGEVLALTPQSAPLLPYCRSPFGELAL